MSIAAPGLEEVLGTLAARLAVIEESLARIEREGLPPRTPIPGEHLQVIAAAVAAVVPGAALITAVQPGDLPPMNLWSFQGRMVTFHSHQTRAGWRR